MKSRDLVLLHPSSFLGQGEVMKVRLVVQRGGRRGKAFPIRPPGAIVGRGQGSTIRIPSAEVSRQHCRIRLAKDVVTVEDLDSVNGTLLNGEPVCAIEEIHPGDRLQIGPVTFVFEVEQTEPDQARPRVDEEEYLAVLEDEEDSLPVVDSGQLGRLAEGEEAPKEPVAPREGQEDAGSIDPGFDFDDASWKPPQGDDLRDILAQMELEAEEDDKPRKKKPKPEK
jgi:pSer/pThr/pTyr-binding forkhead associated (FHA) protein